MNVYYGFGEVPDVRHVVSIGTFDGLHLGHQHLLRSARDRARVLDAPFLVVTFEPPPAKVIRPAAFPGRIVTPDQKLGLLDDAGVSGTLVLEFDAELMHLTPEAFLERLARSAHPVELWVGEEFALGHDRRGDVERLRTIGARLGYDVIPVARTVHADEVISSSRIRRRILAGEVGDASAMLGRPFQVGGVVIEGAKIGRTIGYPTANVEPPPGLVYPADGIYVSLAGLPGEAVRRPAMTYIGTRPALNTGSRLIETHLLDFSGDLYDQVLRTDFLARIRPDATFDSIDALIEQLRRDELATREMLAESGVVPNAAR